MLEKSRNPAEFADFERTGWQERIAGYDGSFGTVSRLTVEPMLDAANIGADMRVLDVCCGPGMLADAAAKRGTKAVGLDFPEVVKLARTLAPNAEFQSGDAQDLPFPDNSFDALVCGYGILHVPDPEKTLREMRRVLRPGGRVAMSSWDIETPNTGLGLIYGAVRMHANLNVPLPHGPDVFQFSTRDKMRDALTEVGFANVAASRFAQNWRVKSGKQLLDAVYNGTVRTRALLATQTQDAIERIIASLEQPFAAVRADDGSFDVPFPAVIGSGAKP